MISNCTQIGHPDSVGALSCPARRLNHDKVAEDRPCFSVSSSCSGVSSSLATLLLAELSDGDTVHVHDALSGEALTHGDGASLLGLVLGLTNDAGSHELLEAVADVLASGHSGVLSVDTAAADLATVVLAESLDADLLPHVELVADRGCAGVKPVIAERAKLTEAGSLNCP